MTIATANASAAAAMPAMNPTGALEAAAAACASELAVTDGDAVWKGLASTVTSAVSDWIGVPNTGETDAVA
jgi:GTP-dependent phosphoenolpyruvate carboxykinase